MAIKISAGAAPRYGRVTMPKGTYLSTPPKFSNPSTAASGPLGAGGGNELPPTPQIPGILQAISSYDTGNPSSTLNTVPETNPLKTYLTNYLSSADFKYSAIGQFLGLSEKAPVHTNPLVSPEQEYARNLLKSQPNALVGQDIGTTPPFIAGHQIKQVFSGMSAQDIQNTMALKGYVRSYQAGVGEIWVKSATPVTPGGGQPSSSAGSGELDARGRPQYVDPTALEPGERIVAASGVGYTGGTDYTNAAGETVSQYAVTIPGKGDRWKYKIKQNENGDWVRVYYRTFGTQNRRTKAANRAKQKNAAQYAKQAQSPVESAVEFHQLVNLRADFG